MKELAVSGGLICLLDDEDYEVLSEFRWQYLKGPRTMYARRSVYDEQGKRKTVLLHRCVIEVPDGMFVDHIDGNGLNNQKSNLRLATKGQNAKNRRLPATSISGYKGVYWYQKTRKWQVQIGADGKRKTIGYFNSAEEGAKAYDDAALRLHGQFASLNFPEHQAQYEYCELTGEFHCPQPMDKPTSRCDLCLGCIDYTLKPPQAV